METKPNIEVVFISLDKSVEKWKKAYDQHGIAKNQFLLTGDFNSELAKYLIMEAIPYYLYIDSNGKVKKISNIEEILFN